MSYLFDCYAPLYDLFMEKMHLDSNSYILLEVREGGKRVLDVGGGTGTLSDVLVKMGKVVTLLDPSISMTNVARRKNVRINIVNLPLTGYQCKEKYDCIILRDCLHHMDNPVQAITKCLKMLNSNGMVIIQDFEPDSLKSRFLFTFERCCFEKIVPIKSKTVKHILEQRKMKVEVRNIFSNQYIIVGRCV